MCVQQNPLKFLLRPVFNSPKNTAENVGILAANHSAAPANYRSTTVTYIRYQTPKERFLKEMGCNYYAE